MGFDSFCASVIGAGHVRKNIPCEDFGMKYETEGAKIFALGDGHGDANCFRSCKGSEFACRCAVQKMSEFAQNISTPFEDVDQFERQVYFLIGDIVAAWKEAVQKDVGEEPFTDTELNSAPNLSDEFRSGKAVERAYGTTLIAGLLTEQYLLLIQQGDGHCDVFDADGKVTQPIPWDACCIGNATTSLCDSDATERFRYTFIDIRANSIVACIAGTDGVEDSFPTSMDKTHAFYRTLILEANTDGMEAMEKALPDRLSDLSQYGSADDITVCGFIDVEKSLALKDLFRQQNEMADLVAQKDLLDNKIMSIEDGGKLSQLRLAFEKANDDFEDAQRSQKAIQESVNEKRKIFEEIRAEYEEYNGRLLSLKDKRSAIEKKLHELASPMDNSDASDLQKQVTIEPNHTDSDK